MNNNVVYYRNREKSKSLNDLKIKTNTQTYIEEKKNPNDKYNVKLTKIKKPKFLDFKIENSIKAKESIKTFETQKKINTINQIENKFTVLKNKTISNIQINYSKSSNSYRNRDKTLINNLNLNKENNLMKFKKKSSYFEDLIPFNDIYNLSNIDNNINKKFYINSNSKSKSKLNENINTSRNTMKIYNNDKSSIFEYSPDIDIRKNVK
jgi:hypothetical protein